jgi:hypothetical protein
LAKQREEYSDAVAGEFLAKITVEWILSRPI